MGTANNMKYRPYLPYIIDGLTALFFCLVVSLGTMIMYVSLGMYEVEGFGQFLLVVYALGFLYECIVNFRFMLLSVIEVHFNLYKSEQLQLVAVRKAYETVWRYESKLPCFFPKYRYVDKTVMDFRREDGSVIQLRCVFHGMNQEGKKNNRSSRKARKTAYRTKKTEK